MSKPEKKGFGLGGAGGNDPKKDGDKKKEGDEKKEGGGKSKPPRSPDPNEEGKGKSGRSFRSFILNSFSKREDPTSLSTVNPKSRRAKNESDSKSTRDKGKNPESSTTNIGTETGTSYFLYSPQTLKEIEKENAARAEAQLNVVEPAAAPAVIPTITTTITTIEQPPPVVTNPLTPVPTTTVPGDGPEGDGTPPPKTINKPKTEEDDEEKAKKDL